MTKTDDQEPAAKKVKPTGWEDHTLNCAEALMKSDEGDHFQAIAENSVATLQGIGPFATRVLEVLKVKTVSDLASYKYFLVARAIATMAEVETDGKRPTGSVMNVDDAVDKKYETKTFREIVESPVAALQGLSEDAGELLKSLGVQTVGDLAKFKYCRWAEAIVNLATYEITKTEAERKKENMLKKLA